MKKIIMLILCAVMLTACADGVNTGKPNSGVMPAPVERNPDGSLINDTEKLPMTGQWCHELDPDLQRMGSPSNCVADY